MASLDRAKVRLPPQMTRFQSRRAERLAHLIVLASLFGNSAGWSEEQAALPQPPVSSPGEYRADAPVREVEGVRFPAAPVFFPPLPPPLDAATGHVSPASHGVRGAPPALADFVGETFYAPFGTLLVKNELSAGQRRRIESYRDSRDKLVAELNAELERVSAFDAASGEAALRLLAERQHSALVELEKSAEALRQNLVDVYYGWFGQRQWHLGESAVRGDTPEEVAAVVRAYAFFKKGFSPGQRGLLREIAVETSLAREDADTAASAQPYFFFSPALSRVLWPKDLPPGLAARIAGFQAKKSALKKQLYDAVYAQESAPVLSIAFRSIATEQQAALAELEELAEGIRRDLRDLGIRAPVAARSPLPRAVTDRAAVLLRRRNALRAEADAKIEAVNRDIDAKEGIVVLDCSFDTAGLGFDVRPARRSRNVPPKDVQRNIAEVRRVMEPIAEAYGRAFAELANETAALRDEIKLKQTAGDPPPDAVLAAAMRFAAIAENADAYRHYRAAVFEPGLSAEQRRLLFGAAVTALRLGLPAGELQPTSRAP